MTTVYTRQTTANNATNLNAILTMAQFDNNLLALNAGKLDNDSNRSIVKPSLVLDFSKKLLDPRVTFSRASTAPYYDGKTSVLAEQNTTLNSAGLTGQLALSLGSATISYNSTTAPDGTTTATSIVPTNGATNAVYYIGNGPTPATNSYTVSLYVKANGMNYIAIGTNNNAVVIEANLSTGLVISGSGFVISAGNGWYRVVATISFYTNGTYYLQVRDTAGTITLSTANGTNGIYVWGAQSEQRSSATAYNATTTALTNYIPQLLTAPINSPRFDFNPTTGESLGLLIEQSSTNLLTYSQDFSNAVWVKSNMSITAGGNIAPDGTQTASLFAENTASSTHQMYRLGVVAGTYTFILYAKAYGRTQVEIQQESGGNSRFTLSGDGTAVALGANTVAITSVGNGWYRCSTTFTATGGVGIYIGTYSGSLSYTGNGYSGIYIWGAQLEALAFATSYIPTTSTALQRSADVPLLPTSGWFNKQQGTFHTEIIPNYTIGTNRVQTVSSDVSSLVQYLNNSTGGLQTFDGTNFALTSNVATANTLSKLVTSYSSVSNTLSACLNGGTVATSSAYNSAFANASNIWIGTSGGALNGRIKKLAYYPQALTSNQLQYLTS